MILSLVVAAADEGVIGQGNQLPWSLPADLQRFKAITLTKPILMGRKTWDSIGRPLPGRRNIVISRQPGLTLAGAEVCASLPAALTLVDAAAEVMVIGGAQLYAQALPLADRVYLTKVHARVPGDAHFILPTNGWRQTACEDHPADARHAHAFSFMVYERS